MITLLAEIQLPEDHGEEDGELDDEDGELDGEDGELDELPVLKYEKRLTALVGDPVAGVVLSDRHLHLRQY